MSVSITSALRVCKSDQGWANKTQSDRFLNPYLVVCPTYNGLDRYGRFSHPDSVYHKSAGCSSGEDRVVVENFLRPSYSEFVSLDVSAITGYDPTPSKTCLDSMYNKYQLEEINKLKN
jgi:hypothetical protein